MKVFLIILIVAGICFYFFVYKKRNDEIVDDSVLDFPHSINDRPNAITF